MIRAAPLRDEAFRVKHSHACSCKNNRQAGAEGAKQNQTEAGTAKRNRGEQKNQRRWARYQAAACAQSDQAADADIAFGRVRMRVAVVRVSQGSVMLVVVIVVMMIVGVRVIMWGMRVDVAMIM